MSGLTTIQWVSLVPLIFWWIYPLGSAIIFEGLAQLFEARERRRKKKDEPGVPYKRRGKRGFAMYEKLRSTWIPKPEPLVFFFVWVVIYLLIGFSTWLFTNWATAERPIFDAQFSLLWANFICNVLWFPLFFIFRRVYLAYIDMWLTMLTGIAICAIRFVDATDDVHANSVPVWVSAGLFVPYPLWLIFVTVLSTDILLTMRGADYTKLGVKTKKKSKRNNL